MIYAENILVCIAVPFTISLLFIKGEVRRYVIAFLLGMGASLAGAYISSFLSLCTGMGQNDTSIFVSPMIEESMKLLLLLFFFILCFPKDANLITLAVAIGAGFATFENCCYILSYGAESLTYIIIRGFAVGVMHIVSILALAIWILFAKQLKVLSFPSVIGGLSLAMTFHSLYNLLVSKPGISSIIGYLLPILFATLLYPLYKKLLPEH